MHGTDEETQELSRAQRTHAGLEERLVEAEGKLAHKYAGEIRRIERTSCIRPRKRELL